jgi:ubiquinone biosynthesis monooxygenase Coq7
MTRPRRLSPLDRLLDEAQRGISGMADDAIALRASPGAPQPDVEMAERQRRHAAGLMRVNHTGEVCAQALYVGQAAVARDEGTREQLLNAAQ